MTRDEIAASQALVVEVFRSFRTQLCEVTGSADFSRKHDHSPVTEWDVKVETALSKALAQQFPGLGFEGEETGRHGSREAYWLTDPIDGTSSFIRGLHYATNMSALVVNNETVAAVIYDFQNDIVYTARKGEGAWKNEQPITINAQRRSGDLVAYSFTRKTFGLLYEALAEIGIRAVLPMGAAGHTYAMLAEGKIDGVIALNTPMGAYDNAPGVLLAEEAGAVMLSYDDKTGVNRHEFIIGTPHLVEEIERSGLI